MKHHLAAYGAGLLFALGVGISGMTQPELIIRFLDFGGDWDPTLLLVIAGGVLTYLVLFRLVIRRPAPLFGKRFRVPNRRDIDGRLVGGAAIFGLGWGLSGFCPGPAITAIPTGALQVGVFLVAMVGGMKLFTWVESLRAARATRTATGEETAFPAT